MATTIDDIVKFNAEIKKQGYITKVEWKYALDGFNRLFEKLYFAEIFNVHFAGKGGEPYNTTQDEKLHALFEKSVYSIRDHLSLGNKLKAVKSPLSKSNSIYQAIEVYYNKYLHYAEMVMELEPLVISTQDAKLRVSAAKKAAIPKEITLSRDKLSTLLQKHIDEYVEEAGKVAGEYYTSTMNKVKAAGGIDEYAPKPDPKKRGTDAYKIAQNKRLFIEGLIKVKKKGYVDYNKEQAHKSYMSWVDKMISKISKPVKSATMVGSPWTGSTLTIKHTDGETEAWNTQMIINQSKYGKMFNQFPTRVVGGRKSLKEFFNE